MKTKVLIGIIVVLAIALVWSLWPKKVAGLTIVNPNWQSEYDAAINAGYAATEAETMANNNYAKYLTA